MVSVCDRQYVSASTLHNCDMRRLGHHRILIILTWHRHHRIIHPSVCFQSVIPTTHLCMCGQKHTPSHTLTHPHIAIRSYTKRHPHISPGRGSLAERLPSRMPILLLPLPPSITLIHKAFLAVFRAIRIHFQESNADFTQMVDCHPPSPSAYMT